jgi:hypothetical protein
MKNPFSRKNQEEMEEESQDSKNSHGPSIEELQKKTEEIEAERERKKFVREEKKFLKEQEKKRKRLEKMMAPILLLLTLLFSYFIYLSGKMP